MTWAIGLGDWLGRLIWAICHKKIRIGDFRAMEFGGFAADANFAKNSAKKAAQFEKGIR
jgi:hypothetical protein